jgi:hypothetical protein
MGIDGSQSARTDLKICRHILQRRRMVPWYAVRGPLTRRKLVTGSRDDARGSRCLQLQNQELRLQKLSQQLLTSAAPSVGRYNLAATSLPNQGLALFAGSSISGTYCILF